MDRRRGRGSPADLVRAARAAGVSDERVLAAMGRLPRAAFAPPGSAGGAYRDEPIPIPGGQVTTQPSLIAMMVAALGLTGSEQVLEVGSGYGYQTAVLASLAAHVVSIEIIPDLAERARLNLAARGAGNVTMLAGDGSQGWEPGAPYDAVIISAAFPEVPSPIVGQCRPGGRIVQPVGPGGDEDVVLFERERVPDGLRRVRSLTRARFVPLRSNGRPPAGRGD